MTTASVDALPQTAAAAARTQPVAVALSRFPTVTETFILREVDEMERQGQPVRLVPLIRENPPIVHDAAKAWIPRAFYTPYLSPAIVAANVRTLLRRPGRYVSLLARLIAGTIRRPAIFVRTLGVFPKAVLMAERLPRDGVRHLHAHYASVPSTVALIISALSDITFSFTVHAADIQTDRSLLDWKLRETRFVRSISAYNKRFLEELYPAEARGKIEVIHVGIVPEQFQALPAPNNAEPKILCVAAHKKYKGLPYLIEACGVLRDEGRRFECNVIGHGPMRGELEALIAKLGLGDVVHLVGARPESEVARMMAECDVFVLPSIVAKGHKDGEQEGIPVALMEAMASGRPVISTTTAGIPELIDDGVSGLLVPPEDPRALAQALRSLFDDPTRAASMGLNGRDKVQREFSLSTCVAQLLARLDSESQELPTS